MPLRRAVGLVFAAALMAACSGTPATTPTDSGTAGATGGGAGTVGSDAGAGRAAAGAGGTGTAGTGSASAGVAGTGSAGTVAAGSDAGAAGHSDAGTPSDGPGLPTGGGCGMPAPTVPVPAPKDGYVPYQVMLTGATLAGPRPAKAGARKYWVHVPPDYDPHRAYRTVFQSGACTTGTALPPTFALYDPSVGGNAQAIYVVVDAGPADMALRCYDTSLGLESTDFEAFALVHDAVAARYCVDEERVFVVSKGPSVANQLGCYFGGKPDPTRPFGKTLHVRGQALYAGWGEPAVQPPCHGPVGAIWFDDLQSQAPQKPSTEALARVIAQDGCTPGAATMPWGKSSFPCKEAVGCAAGVHVVQCATVFGRNDQASLTTAMFEAFMTEASAAASP